MEGRERKMLHELSYTTSVCCCKGTDVVTRESWAVGSGTLNFEL